MNKLNEVTIAEDFSRYPAGRYKDDGPFSGEHFREVFLIPILESGEKTIIHLDGVRGYGSSFLEEAFGGLVRLGYSPQQVNDCIELTSDDDGLIDEIRYYINHGSDDSM